MGHESQVLVQRGKATWNEAFSISRRNHIIDLDSPMGFLAGIPILACTIPVTFFRSWLGVPGRTFLPNSAGASLPSPHRVSGCAPDRAGVGTSELAEQRIVNPGGVPFPVSLFGIRHSVEFFIGVTEIRRLIRTTGRHALLVEYVVSVCR
jgi:hypothetical protein